MAASASADDAPQLARFTTRAPHAEIVAAACAYHADVDGRPVDVSVDGRRCTFGLVPRDAVALEVRVAGDTVTLAGPRSQDAGEKIEQRLRFGDRFHADTYVVSKQVPRSATLRDAGLISATLGGAGLLTAPMLALVATWHPLGSFCLNFDDQPCKASPPPDNGGLALAAAISGIAGATLFTLGVIAFSVGRTKLALISAQITPMGGALRIAF